MSGFVFFNRLEDDLVSLMSIVNAENRNLAFLNDPRVDAIMPHQVLILSHMVEEMLISSAVRLRMIEDRFTALGESFAYPYPPDEVCRFTYGNATSGDRYKSGLRLAADKIVHASRVSFIEDQGYDLVTISGMKSGHEWEVQVDTVKFAIAGLCLHAQYENDMRISSVNPDDPAGDFQSDDS